MASAASKPPEEETFNSGVHHDEDKANSDSNSTASTRSRKRDADGNYELRETDAWNVLGYSFSSFKKWRILFVVFWIQIYINANASMYSNAVERISEHHHVSMAKARVPQAMFLIAYGFGCELWAPWSEEYGRWPIQQASLLLLNM